MTPSKKLKLSQMTTVAKALGVAAADAWSSGRLKEAAALYLRADVASSRARDFEIEAILREDAAAREALRNHGGGRMML